MATMTSNHITTAPVRHERSRNNNDALLVAGVALGGIALGALLGSVMSQQNTTREVVYSDPTYTQPSGYSTAYNYTFLPASGSP